MNVIVSNTKTNELTSLDIDVIKSITGEYNTDELISMFKSFFYEKMIVDITSIKNYQDINSVERLAMGLGAEKIILLLTDELCNGPYLSGLIDVGIYNFTNNINAIKRLIARPNTFDDVKKIQQMSNNSTSNGSSVNSDITKPISCKVIGIKNLTSHAGATTLTYMLVKELKNIVSTGVYGFEVDKRDFLYFNNRDLRSITSSELKSELSKLPNAKVIFVDLNDYDNLGMCNDVIYLLEPSTIKLNSLIKSNSKIFEKIRGKKIILNKSVLSNKDVTEFEYESNSKVFYNIPFLDDRESNNILVDFLSRLGLIDATGSKQADGSKLFGIFRR